MELIKIYQGNLIDAKELHAFLEIKSPFRKWVERYIIKLFNEGIDFRTKLSENKKQGRGRPSKEYFLTIDTAKRLAMMAKTSRGDEARNYFLECEKIILSFKNNKRLEAFSKLAATKEKFKGNVIGLGGNEKDYIQIDYKARKVLFNGELLEDDVLNTVLLKGRDFAIEMTNGGIKTEDISDLEKVEKLAEESHNDVRQAIIKNMKIKPEEIPTEDDIKKLKE